MDGFVDVSQKFYTDLKELAMLLVAIVRPQPVATVPLDFFLFKSLRFILTLFLFL